GGERVRDADPRLERLPALPLERREHEQPREREPEGANHGEQPLARLAVLVHAREAAQEEREGDAGGRQLRQRDPEEDHAAEHEVNADERAHEPDEDARDERVVEEEVGAQELGHRDLSTVVPNASATRSVASISRVAPFVAPPSPTQMTDSTTSA